MCLSGSPIKVIPGLKKKAIHFVEACLLQWVLLSNAFYLQICAVQAPCWVCCDKWVWVFHQPLSSATDMACSPPSEGSHHRVAGFPLSLAGEKSALGPLIFSVCTELTTQWNFQSITGSTLGSSWLNFLKRSQVNPSISAHAKI